MRRVTTDSFLLSSLASCGCVAVLLLVIGITRRLNEQDAMLASLWTAGALLLLLWQLVRRNGDALRGGAIARGQAEQVRARLEARLAGLEADDPLRGEVALALEHLALVIVPRMAVALDPLAAQ